MSLAGPRMGGRARGYLDAFVQRYDRVGRRLCTRLISTERADQASGIAVGQAGVYIVGSVSGSTVPSAANRANEEFVR